jgi:hypothetical protein
MLFGKGGCCCFRYRPAVQQGARRRRINISAVQTLRSASLAVRNSLGSLPQVGKDPMVSKILQFGTRMLISQLLSRTLGGNSRGLGGRRPNSLPTGTISPTASISPTANVSPTVGVPIGGSPADPGNSGPGGNDDGPNREIESILSGFPIGRPTTIGFYDQGYWTGLWGGLQGQEARLTNAQLYDNSGNAVGAPQDNFRIAVNQITYVV